MSFFSKFERKMEDGVEVAASKFENSALTPVQITKKAEKQMKREKMVGAGKQIAPTLYTILVSEVDDERLFGYYPTLAGEVETYLAAKASDLGYVMDGKPLVRFIADPDLKRGKFDVIAELVSAPTVAKLREDENKRYGIQAPQSSNPPLAQPKPNQVQKPAPQKPVPQKSQAYPYDGAKSVNESVPVAPDFSPSGVDDDNIAPIQQHFIPTSEETQVVAPVAPAQVEEVYLYDEANDIAYRLSGKSEKIGRESSNDVVVSDINASRVHAEIHRESNGTWIVSDLNSTNGLFVNGRRVKSAPLNDADIILIGTTRLEFQLL